jgi:hypothetical protein
MHSTRLLARQKCQNTSCPAVHATAGGTVLVQGNLVDAESAHLVLGDGESVVEISAELLLEAARQLEGADA